MKVTWPKQPCRICGQQIMLIRGRLGWVPYDLQPQVPHRCGDPLDHTIASRTTTGMRQLRAFQKRQPLH
jgi:hypothetical protein